MPNGFITPLAFYKGQRVEILGTGLTARILKRADQQFSVWWVELIREPNAYARKLLRVHGRQIKALEAAA